VTKVTDFKGLLVVHTLWWGKEEKAWLRSCHTRKEVGTGRFRFQKRYVAQKVSKKPIQPMKLRDKRVPFWETPPKQV